MNSRSAQTIRRFDRRDTSSRWARFKCVPDDASLRVRIRDIAAAEIAGLVVETAPARATLESVARKTLTRLALPDDYLGFAMVLAANAWWADPLTGVPYERRLLLLPRCLEHVGGQDDRPGDIGAIRRRAEQLGYRTLIADGTPIVVKTLASGSIEAVVGVACLDSLEAVFDKIWRLGVPAVAVPLLNSNCHDTSADLSWLAEYVETHDPSAPRPKGSWLGLLQVTGAVFEPPRLDALLAPAEPNAHGEALDATSEIARRWLAGDGKRLRPFIALAAAAAVSDAPPETLGDGAARVAVAIEAFHKASLAHDDIEDDDDQRYGRPTLHRAHGQAMAINVGDYLLGLGYRLIATAAGELPDGVGAGVAEHMSRAHVHLAQGQGAELLWRRDGAPAPPSQQVLKVYALKTAPAFAAALASGVLLGGGQIPDDRGLDVFARHIGVGFQVLNDLSGWADDARAARPTYLTALAAETASPTQREQLNALLAAAAQSPRALDDLTALLDSLGVFKTANSLVGRLKARAAAGAEHMNPPALADLCGFLVELILT